MTDLKWGGDRGGTSRVAWLDEVLAVDTAIGVLEKVSGQKTDWDWDDETGFSWWGVVGSYKDVTFTLYTHKSGTLKMGGAYGLDVAGAKAAVLALLSDAGVEFFKKEVV